MCEENEMAPNHGYVLTDVSGEPVSRTYQYRKVMKPMLERKRRARINRCLDELKDLMTGALQTVSNLKNYSTNPLEIFRSARQTTNF